MQQCNTIDEGVDVYYTRALRGVTVQGKIMITWDSVNSFIMRYVGKLIGLKT